MANTWFDKCKLTITQSMTLVYFLLLKLNIQDTSREAQCWWGVVLLFGNTCALLNIKEDSRDNLRNMAVVLNQQILQGPYYCVHVVSDDSNLARNVLEAVMMSSSVPISWGQCTGFAVGIFIAQNATSIISSITNSTQHFQRLILLAPDSLQKVLDKPSLFANSSLEVVAANCSSVFRLTSPQDLKFQRLASENKLQRQLHLPNLQGRTLRVATYHCPPFSYRNNWERVVHNGLIPIGVPDGVEMAVFLALSKRLNFTWQLQELDSSNTMGHRNANGSWSGGIMGSISQRLADIAFCGIYVEEQIMEQIDLTIPWTHYCLTYLVPRYAPSFRFAVLRTFEPVLWLAVTVVMLGTSVIYWLLSHCKQRHQSMTRALLTALGMLSLSSFPEHKSQLGTLRPLVVSWSVFSLLLTTALSSGLVSHLTRPTPTTQLNSVRDLVEADITWGEPYKQDYSRTFNLQNPWHAQFIDRFKLEVNPCERVSRVKEGHYAILGGKLDGNAQYFMEKDTLKDTGLLPRLHVMRECLIRHYAAMGLTKGSPLTQYVSRALRWLLEAGLVEHWQADLVRIHGNPDIKLLFQKIHYTGPQQLTWTHLEDEFLLLLIGLAAATLVFLLEVCRSRLIAQMWQ